MTNRANLIFRNLIWLISFNSKDSQTTFYTMLHIIEIYKFHYKVHLTQYDAIL